jgi:hypothetical protein
MENSGVAPIKLKRFVAIIIKVNIKIQIEKLLIDTAKTLLLLLSNIFAVYETKTNNEQIAADKNISPPIAISSECNIE